MDFSFDKTLGEVTIGEALFFFVVVCLVITVLSFFFPAESVENLSCL